MIKKRLRSLGSELDTFAEEMFRRENGEPLRMRDLAIPYETVVAGVRRQSFDRLPARFRRAATEPSVGRARTGRSCSPSWLRRQARRPLTS